MGAKKIKKPLKEPGTKNKKPAPTAAAESDLSAISTGSFIEGLKQNGGAPLHSTAIEEDLLDPTEEKQVQKRSPEQTAKPQSKENTKKPKSTLQKSKKPAPAANPVDQKKTVKRKSAADFDEAQPEVKRKRKKVTAAASAEPDDPESPEQSDGNVSPQSHRGAFTSDEELEESWEPSPKKRKDKRFGPTRPRTSSSDKSRKASSGSGDEPGKVRPKKKMNQVGVTRLDVVLEEFLDFFQQYKEQVESNAVKKALDVFASNVEEQLTEKISSNKQLKTLMRENTKLASAIQTKRQRLLDAKNELIKSERQLWLLKKENSELKQKAKDFKRSQTFLKNVQELHARYRQHRQKHPEEKETYDASSLAALLLEAQHVQTTELQLKAINDGLESAVNKK